MSRAGFAPGWVRRGLLRAGGLGLGLVVLSGGGLALLLFTPPGWRLMERLGEAAFGVAFPEAEVSLAGLRVGPDGEIALGQAVLRHPDGQEVLRVERLRIALGRPSPRARHLRLRSLELGRLELDLRPGAEALRLVEALGPPPSDEPGAPWGGIPGALTVERLVLAEGRLLTALGPVEDLRGASRLVLRGREARIEDLHLDGVLAEAERLPLRLEGALSLVRGELRVEPLRLEAGEGGSEAQLLLRGRVAEVETAPQFDLQLSLPVLRPAFWAHGPDLPRPVVELAAQAELAGPLDALVASLRVDAGPAGRASGIGRLDLVQDPPAFGLDLDLRPFDLAALDPALALPLSAASLRLELRGSGLSWPDGLTAHLTGHLDEALLARPDAPPLEIPSLVLRGQLHQGQGSLIELRLSHPAGTIRGTGALDVRAPSADLRLQVEAEDLRPLSGLLGTPIAGRLAWTPRLLFEGGERFELRLGGPLSSPALELAGLRARGLGGPLGLRYDADGLAVATRLSWAGARVETLELGAGSAQVALGWSEAEGGRVSGDLALQGLREDGTGLRLDALWGPFGGRFGGEEAASVAADLGLRGLRREAMVEGDALDGGLGLAMRGAQIDLDLDLREGEGRPSLQAVGRIRQGDPLEVRLSRLFLEPLPGISWETAAPLRLVLQDQQPRELDVQLDGTAGSLRLARGSEQDPLHVRLESVDLESLGRVARWAGLADPALEGRMDLELRLDLPGQERRGAAPEVEGRLRLVELGQGELVKGLDAELRVEGPVALPRLSLAAGGEIDAEPLLSAELELPLRGARLHCAGRLRGRARLRPVEGDSLRAHLPPLPEGALRASAELRLSGSPCAPLADLVAAVERPAGAGDRIFRVDLEGRQEGDALALRAFVEEGLHRRLWIAGTLGTGLGSALAQAGDAAVDDAPAGADGIMLNFVPLELHLEDLARYGGLSTGVQGRVAGGFQLQGGEADPRLSGALQLIAARVGGVELESGLLMVVPDGELYRLSSQLSFPGRGEGEPSRTLLLDGELRAAPGEGLAGLRLSGRGEGTLPLELGNGLVPGVESATGDLDLQVQAEGSLLDPALSGSLALAGASLLLPGLGLRVEDLDLSAELGPEALRLRRLSARTRRLGSSLRLSRGAGSLLLRGEARLREGAVEEVAATARLDELWVLGLPDREVALSGDLRLHGPWPGARLDGELSLAAAQLRIDESSFLGDRQLQLDPRLRVLRPGEGEVGPTAGGPPAPSALAGLDVDVRLDLMRNLRLSATVPLNQDYGQQLAHLSAVGLDADLGGELRVRTRDGAPSLEGEIEALRGSATVLGVPFDLQSGTIAFLGDGYDDPLVDIHAVRRTGRYGDVDVSVSGRLSDLVIDPSSESYPDKQDVVTLLLFGKPASEMDSSQGGAASQVIGATVSALTGQLEQAVGATLFDELRIDPAGAVRVGWALNSRLFLRLEQRLVASSDSANRTELTLEYLITRRMYAEFVSGDRAASKAHLYWRWRF